MYVKESHASSSNLLSAEFCHQSRLPRDSRESHDPRGRSEEKFKHQMACRPVDGTCLHFMWHRKSKREGFAKILGHFAVGSRCPIEVSSAHHQRERSEGAE